MEFLDVDRALDLRAVVEYTGDMPAVQFSRKMDFSFQAGLHFSDKDLEFSYFIPAQFAQNRDLSILLAQTGAIRYGDLYFMNYSLTNPSLYGALEMIKRSGQSFILDSLIIEKGKYLLSIRFAERDLEAFSRVMMKFTNLLQGLSLRYLGKNPGFRTIMTETRHAGSLNRIRVRMTPSKEDLQSDLFRSLGDEWVSEIRFMTKGVPISGLFRTQKPIELANGSEFSAISGSANLYEHQFLDRASFINQLHSLFYESRIVRFGRTMHFKDGSIVLQNVVPKIQLTSVLQIMEDFQGLFPDWDISISSVEGCTTC